MPLVIKISPDIESKSLKKLIEVSIKYKLNGIIATNTTINKHVLSRGQKKIPDGGISGKPLFKVSNKILKQVKLLSKNNLDIIGLGGVDSGETAHQKLKLGASAVQIYSGLVFKGPDLVEKILYSLLFILKRDKK